MNPLRAVDAALRVAAGFALAAAGLAIFAQIIARHVFDAPLIWPEEFATLLFSWITFLGAAAVQRDDSHLSVDSARAIASPRVQAAMDLLRRAVIAACSGVLLWQGIVISLRMWTLEYPAMGISRSAIYLSVTVGAMFSLLFALRCAWRRTPPGSGSVVAQDP